MTIDPGVIAAAATLLAALIAIVGVIIGQMWVRLAALEERVEKVTQQNRRLWLWARKHIDLYYTWRRPDAPDPDAIPSEDD